ncbi:SET domain-containing protein [Paraburkholderia strydomiana]|uniref:SET domain-containing protein n=1 Tax=Paraburkholderia strydomiana TaxID=1245417 RepID=UPI001BE85A66|nr:SET domain-containing protein-lysine N-methyltransferase [Paraburkholderia strydomiana]MBT2792840.1 SET domain-containing protein-lysine N-methyltransferase [Paraburkholderia strydomiana]
MKRISVRRSSIHGRGVFALRPLRAGELILEYTGTVMSWKRAISRHRRFGEEGHTFLFGLSDGRVIDGSLGGNSARWLNHACVANCEAVESKGRVYIQAIGDIRPGEELSIAYGLTTDGRPSAAVRRQYACRCGHRRCRGTMLAGA